MEAMKAGAYDYVGKPFKPDEIVLALRKAEERETLRRENRALREQIRNEAKFEQILAKSVAMETIFRTIAKIADFKTTVLISGESGVGKELVARALHARSHRSTGPFVAINCGAIPENLLESELFGHRKGAFTDANQRPPRPLRGKRPVGTLLLDEIGELPLNLQVKLLRVLQEETIRRLGDTKDVKIDVRIIAATPPRSAGRGQRRALPRRSLLPHQRPAFGHSSLARTTRGHRAAPRALHRAKQRSTRHARPRASRGGEVAPRQLQLAWQRARAGEHGRTCDGARRERRPRCRRIAGEDRARASPGADAAGDWGTFDQKNGPGGGRDVDPSRADKTKATARGAAEVLEISHRALLYKIKDYNITDL